MNRIPKEPENRLKNILLSLLFALLSSALGLLIWTTSYGLIQKLLRMSSIEPWKWSAINSSFVIFFGVIWLSFAYYVQHFYRKSAEKKNLTKNVLFITGIQLLLLSLIQWLMFLFAAVRFAGANLFLLIAQCFFGSAFTIVSRLNLKKPILRNT